MRTLVLASALMLGLAGVALADARVLSVGEDAAASGDVAGQQVAPANPAAGQSESGQQPAAPVQVETAAPQAASAPAARQEVQPPARFRFERTNDGFLRLDNQNGQIAFCSAHAAGWACEAVPEDRAALEKEIARQQDEIGSQQKEIGRLQGQVADLKDEIARLRAPPPAPRPPADLAPRPSPKEGAKPDAKDGDVVIKLPTQEDIDRATAALQRAWDRVVGMIDNLRRDLSRRGQPDRTTL